MQGHGLNCISHVIISLVMDHDKNECLGPFAVTEHCEHLCVGAFDFHHSLYSCYFPWIPYTMFHVGQPLCLCGSICCFQHVSTYTHRENKSYFMHACSLQPIQFNATQEETVNYD